MALANSTQPTATEASPAAPPRVCPACGGVNAPSAVFCADPACHKALGGFAYVREELKKEARWHEALADKVVGWIGKPHFLGVHLLWFLAWTAINTGLLVMAPRFDAPPFALLGIILAMETIFITGFVLISQNQQSKYDAKRAELDYEVNVQTFRKIEELEAALQLVLARLDAADGLPGRGRGAGMTAALALFYRQLATLLGAGVPIHEALTTLLQQHQPRALRECLTVVSASVLRGMALSQAMAACPRHFTGFAVATVAAGERSGDFVLALRRLAEHGEEEQAFQREVRRETFSSKLTMALALVFWPVVLARFGGSPLLLALAGVLPLLLFGLLLLVGAVLPRLSGRSALWEDRLISHIPVLGRTARLIWQTHFARTLSFLYHAGISLPEAVRWSCDASGNAYLAGRVRAGALRLDRGEGLASTLESAGLLDPVLVTMLKTGEQTGDFEAVLDKAAEHFRLMTDVALHQLKSALGVATTLSVGLCVALILIGFYA